MSSLSHISAHTIESFGEEAVRGLLKNNRQLILLANQLRHTLDSSPTQSNFRVVAIFIVEHGDSDTRIVSAVCGANTEPGNINGSICAERAAICRLRFLVQPTILKVGVVTDSPQPISPGPLCREFLSAVADLTTPIVIGNGRGDKFFEYPLSILIPHPYVYRKQLRHQIVSFAKDFGSTCFPCTSSYSGILSADLRQRLLAAASEVNEYDREDSLHPIRLSAAVLYSDGTTSSAWQMKGLEYGCTGDPVEAVVHNMAHTMTLKHYNPSGAFLRPVALVMIDQYGVCHAPFARSRSLLMEHGFGDVLVLCHQEDGQLHDVAVDELLPTPKDIQMLTQEDFLTHEEFINK
jgi:cytidine deaminase